MSKGLEAFNKIKNTTYWNDIPTEYFPEECSLIEKELKALETLKDLIGNVEIEQYNKKPSRYELKMCGKTFYINQEQYQALKNILY